MRQNTVVLLARSINFPSGTGRLQSFYIGQRGLDRLLNNKSVECDHPSSLSWIAARTVVRNKSTMRQTVKCQPAGRGRVHLVGLAAAVGLATGSMIVPLDAAQRRLAPLPRARPALERQSSSPVTASQPGGQQQKSGQTDSAGREDEACLARLRAADIRFDIPTMPITSNPACVIETPVRLKSIATRMRAATEVRLPEEPVVSCQYAERLADWLGRLVAPLIRGRMSADLRAVRTGPGYECRNRNGAAVGKLSEHAIGKAIDISGFELSNGKFISIKPDGDEATREVVDSVRTAACGWFTTVLGPGSDAAHTDHLHVDMVLHGTSDRYRICQ